MTIALLTIGTELTRGELTDTNSTWLANELSQLGHEVTEKRTVDDDDDRIVQTLRELARNHTAVVVTGGLGPTTDDRTAAACALALGVPLERDARSLEQITALFRARGRVMHPMNEKQADFPRGARVLENPYGTAPGFSVELEGTLFFFTPGVPAEMRGIFDGSIRQLLPPPERPIHHLRLRTFAVPESEVAGLLDGVEERWGVTLGYRASDAEVEVKVLGRRTSTEREEEALVRVRGAFDDALSRLGSRVFTTLHENIVETLCRVLSEHGLTLGLAESCTGGLLSHWVTTAPGSSRYFLGGIVSYSNTVKNAVLGVDRVTLDTEGAVCSKVAVQMAEGARRTLGTDVGIGITGIAGPSGGSAGKPVGLVHYAVALEGLTEAQQVIFRGDRSQIQKRAATHAAFLAWRLLQSRA